MLQLSRLRNNTYSSLKITLFDKVGDTFAGDAEQGNSVRWLCVSPVLISIATSAYDTPSTPTTSEIKFCCSDVYVSKPLNIEDMKRHV